MTDLIYLTVQCPKCGYIQGMYSKNPYKSMLYCKKCEKSTKLYNNHNRVVKIIKSSNDPYEIVDSVKKCNLNPEIVNWKG